MDYDKLKKELEENDDWERAYPKSYLSSLEGKHALNSAWMSFGQLPTIDGWTGQEDRVNSPSHYTRGQQEVIDTIEQAVEDAPTPAKGLLQGQVLKYMLRVWLKDNPLEDLKKAQWYLNRLIDKMEN